MIAYRITTTEKTKGFAPCIFVETLGGVYVEQPGSGFFKHPTIKTHIQLKDHINKLKKEGFEIAETTITT